jgi:hypothetical protein
MSFIDWGSLGIREHLYPFLLFFGENINYPSFFGDSLLLFQPLKNIQIGITGKEIRIIERKDYFLRSQAIRTKDNPRSILIKEPGRGFDTFKSIPLPRFLGPIS